MPTKSKNTQRRTSAKDLPAKQKALSKGAQKNVKGGFAGGVYVAAGDVTGDNVANNPAASGGPNVHRP